MSCFEWQEAWSRTNFFLKKWSMFQIPQEIFFSLSFFFYFKLGEHTWKHNDDQNYLADLLFTPPVSSVNPQLCRGRAPQLTMLLHIFQSGVRILYFSQKGLFFFKSKLAPFVTPTLCLVSNAVGLSDA